MGRKVAKRASLEERLDGEQGVYFEVTINFDVRRPKKLEYYSHSTPYSLVSHGGSQLHPAAAACLGAHVSAA